MFWLLGSSISLTALAADMPFLSTYAPAWMLFPLGLFCCADTKASMLLTTPFSFSTRAIARPTRALGDLDRHLATAFARATQLGRTHPGSNAYPKYPTPAIPPPKTMTTTRQAQPLRRFLPLSPLPPRPFPLPAFGSSSSRSSSPPPAKKACSPWSGPGSRVDLRFGLGAAAGGRLRAADTRRSAVEVGLLTGVPGGLVPVRVVGVGGVGDLVLRPVVPATVVVLLLVLPVVLLLTLIDVLLLLLAGVLLLVPLLPRPWKRRRPWS